MLPFTWFPYPVLRLHSLLVSDFVWFPDSLTILSSCLFAFSIQYCFFEFLWVFWSNLWPLISFLHSSPVLRVLTSPVHSLTSLMSFLSNCFFYLMSPRSLWSWLFPSCNSGLIIVPSEFDDKRYNYLDSPETGFHSLHWVLVRWYILLWPDIFRGLQCPIVPDDYWCQTFSSLRV